MQTNHFGEYPLTRLARALQLATCPLNHHPYVAQSGSASINRRVAATGVSDAPFTRRGSSYHGYLPLLSM
jgi:hypothetical protein